MMARNTNVPFKGRIQKRKTYHLLDSLDSHSRNLDHPFPFLRLAV
jgi:hypothetical protein